PPCHANSACQDTDDNTHGILVSFGATADTSTPCVWSDGILAGGAVPRSLPAAFHVWYIAKLACVARPLGSMFSLFVAGSGVIMSFLPPPVRTLAGSFRKLRAPTAL
ncbi:unnamed protein product, partial [Ectocarpus fasciculatus]